MKRYRVVSFDFDSRSHILEPGYADNLNDEARAQWERRRIDLIRAIAFEYGTQYLSVKVDNFAAIGRKPISIVAFHNQFFEEARRAFVHCDYYPSLTGVCALGERILNHLLITFREDFKATPEYKKVYCKNSFDNWDLAIDTLESWGIIRPETATVFRDLKETRNRSLHFRPDLDKNARDEALKAIGQMNKILELQFTSFGNVPWFITEIRGAAYVRKSFEDDPFVKKIVLPNAVYVGSKARIEHVGNGRWKVHDGHEYEDKEISDEEFKALVDPEK